MAENAPEAGAAQPGMMKRTTTVTAFEWRPGSPRNGGMLPSAPMLPGPSQMIRAAARHGNVEELKTLLSHGDMTASINDEEGGPLLLAASHGHAGCAELLLVKKADVNGPGKYNATPLFVAVQEGHYDVVSLLLGHGANVNAAVTKDGCTPAYMATSKNHASVLQQLIAAGADLNLARIDGSTPLATACKKGNFQIARTLIDAGADIEVSNKQGKTPFMMAVEYMQTGTAAMRKDAFLAMLEPHRARTAEAKVAELQKKLDALSACEADVGDSGETAAQRAAQRRKASVQRREDSRKERGSPGSPEVDAVTASNRSTEPADAEFAPPPVAVDDAAGDDEPAAKSPPVKKLSPPKAAGGDAPSQRGVPASQRGNTSQRSGPKKKKKAGGSVAEKAAALSAVAEAS